MSGYLIPKELFKIVRLHSKTDKSDAVSFCKDYCKDKYDLDLILKYDPFEEFLKAHEPGMFASLGLFGAEEGCDNILDDADKIIGIRDFETNTEFSYLWDLFCGVRIPSKYVIEPPFIKIRVTSEIISNQIVTVKSVLYINGGRHEFFELETPKCRMVCNTEELTDLPFIPLKSKTKFVNYIKEIVYYNSLDHGICSINRFGG